MMMMMRRRARLCWGHFCYVVLTGLVVRQYGAKSIGTGSVLISQSLLLKKLSVNCGWLDTVGPHGPCANTFGPP